MRQKLTKTRHPGIFKRSDGRLVVRVRAINPRTGKESDRSKTLTPGATIAEAKRTAVAMREEVLNGGNKAVKIPTLSAYTETWGSRKLARGDWNPGTTTAKNAMRMLYQHVWPTLGDLLLDQITRHDLIAWVDQMVANNKPATVANRWAALRGLLREACLEYDLTDPCFGVRIPSVTRKGGADMTLTPKQVRQVVHDAKHNEPQLYPLIVLGFASGARISELLAARVQSLDLSDEVGVWSIDSHVTAYGLQPSTKTGHNRIAYLDPWTTKELSDWCHNEQAGTFLNPMNRPTLSNKWHVYEGMQRIYQRLGLGEYHGTKVFRQTYITLCNLAQIGNAHTKDQVGHSSDRMLGVYTRTPEELRKVAASKFGNVIQINDFRTERGTKRGTESKKEASAQ